MAGVGGEGDPPDGWGCLTTQPIPHLTDGSLQRVVNGGTGAGRPGRWSTMQHPLDLGNEVASDLSRSSLGGGWRVEGTEAAPWGGE